MSPDLGIDEQARVLTEAPTRAKAELCERIPFLHRNQGNSKGSEKSGDIEGVIIHTVREHESEEQARTFR